MWGKASPAFQTFPRPAAEPALILILFIMWEMGIVMYVVVMGFLIMVNVWLVVGMLLLPRQEQVCQVKQRVDGHQEDQFELQEFAEDIEQEGDLQFDQHYHNYQLDQVDQLL